MNPRNLVESSIFPDMFFVEREDVYRQFYNKINNRFFLLNNICSNIIQISNSNKKDLEKFSDMIKVIYESYHVELTNKEFKFDTICSPIDRAYLLTLSIFCNKVDYYYYEMGTNIYAFESYENGKLIKIDKTDSQKFLYDYGKELGLLKEITDQINIVKDLLLINDIDDIDDIEDLGDLVDDDGISLNDSIYNHTWFFDSDGLKKYLREHGN